MHHDYSTRPALLQVTDGMLPIRCLKGIAAVTIGMLHTRMLVQV